MNRSPRTSRWITLVAVLTAALLVTGCTPSGTGGMTDGPRSGPAGSGPTSGPSEPREPGQNEERNAAGRVQGTSPDRPDTALAPSTVPGIGPALGDLQAYLDQGIQWERCGTAECAAIRAPLNWSDPGDRSLELQLLRVPAKRQPARGSIFVNPGGPGQGGRALAQSFSTDGLEDFDVVGWDPRGTGESTPVQCLDGPATDAFLETNPAPQTDAEYETYRQAAFDFGQACAEHSGDLLDHISTEDTVRDLDLMRHLVGDAKLSYLGYSYGTQIGATYAHVFPENAGAIVLDAPVNISDEEGAIQAIGFDRQLRAYAEWCVADRSCDLGDSPDAVIERITALVESLRHSPLPVGDRQLTLSLAVSAIILPLYGGPDSWQFVSRMITSAEGGDGDAMLRVADAMNDRSAAGSYDTLTYAFWAIQCVDWKDRGLAVGREQWAQDQQQAPFFGKYFGPSVICEQWPTGARDEPDITGEGAPGVLIVASTGDSATPYEEALKTHQAMVGSVLVTREGDGHGSYGMGNACVDDHVVRHLTGAGLPDQDATC
ncbi:alpha/beta fold hydrolase [Parenemella sanctibonifatiensis]|uniref:Uncharacterized protein n=1 Tax=Parenemella sanctibonifatiensis TaxID=2016505 RepID=A0A255DZW2_9ACTN|nr:alpha/beta fold hydrolase [Parenemella sanctibonifatiensis]OYN84620.1 hypothetical protein CGZ92_12345 [Parenemella sanctibonifatiensis]